MPTFYGDYCPVCGQALPMRGGRLVRIPWLGGKRRRVHVGCVADVERQATIGGAS